jgi:quercetin dioxygenase-like cupin family protein
MSSRIAVERPETAPALWVLGDRVRFMGTMEEKGLHLLDVTIPPGSGTPPHRHASPEAFRVWQGEVTFDFFEGAVSSTVVAGPGSIVTLPAWVGHCYRNKGAAPALMTAIVDGQMVDFFKEVGQPEPLAGPPSAEMMSHLASACMRHGIEILQADGGGKG